MESTGAVAQMGERCNRTAEVRGSNPLSSTKFFNDLHGLLPSWISKRRNFKLNSGSRQDAGTPALGKGAT